METTPQLLTWIEEQCDGWQREGVRGTRPLLNVAHKLLLYSESEQNIVYDPATGDLPFLATTKFSISGTFQYNLPTNCWRLKAMLIDRDQTVDEDFHLEDYVIAGKNYYRLLNIKSEDERLNQVALVTFNIDPGTTTSLYREFYYKSPRNISSDSIDHQMPGDTDMDYLVPATIKLIEGINHGNLIEAKNYISTVLKPAMQKEMDGGEQGVSGFVIKRAF